MSITVVFDPPQPSDSPTVFNQKAFTALADWNEWTVEANQLAVDVNADKDLADASAAAAATSASTATTKAAEALSSKNAAEAAQAAVAASQAAAATSASGAAASQTAAATSASTATTKAAEALSSKNAAELAESNAEAAQASAAASQTAAATSETNAAASQVAAAASASMASTKAAEALSSKNAAETAETNAETAEAAAATSASAAAGSATAADAAKVAAQAARDEAEQWADAPVNTPVAPGQYSAKHWAQQAQATVTGQLVYRGTHNASSGSYPAAPALGDYWKISVAGVMGGTPFTAGDSLIYNGSGWDKIDSTDQVTSVAGRVGDVVVTKADVGLGNVDNTSDANKPVSTAQQAALDVKAAGPAGATDNALARFDGATGRYLQNSNATVDDAGILSAAGASFSGLVVAAELKAEGAFPTVVFKDTDSATDRKWGRWVYTDGNLRFEKINDAVTAVLSTPIIFDADNNATFSHNVAIAGTVSLGNNRNTHWANASGSFSGGTAGASIVKYTDNHWYFQNFEGDYRFQGAGFAELWRLNSSASTFSVGVTAPSFTTSSGYLFGGSSHYLYSSGGDTATLRVGTTPSYLNFINQSGVTLIDGASGTLRLGAGGTTYQTFSGGVTSFSVPVTQGAALGIVDWNTVTQTGWYMAAGAANAPVPGVWFIGYSVSHNNDWITQEVWRFSDNSSTDIGKFRREKDNGTWGAWVRVYGTAQEIASLAPTLNGTGATGTWPISVSGNAATVSNGVYTNVDQAITAAKRFDCSNTAMANAAGGLAPLEARGTGGAAFMTFHRPSTHAAYFGLDSDNQWKVGGWSMGAVAYKLWHEGNDGSGSGLDADVVRGAAPSTSPGAWSLAQRDGNGYLFGNYFNMTADTQTIQPTKVAIETSADGYLRWQDFAQFKRNQDRMAYRETAGGTLVTGLTYCIWTGGGPITMYLPTYANTELGDRIVLTNLHLTWGTNNFTVAVQAQTQIMQLTENLVCNINVGGITLVCVHKDGSWAYWNIT